MGGRGTNKRERSRRERERERRERREERREKKNEYKRQQTMQSRQSHRWQPAYARHTHIGRTVRWMARFGMRMIGLFTCTSLFESVPWPGEQQQSAEKKEYKSGE
jgi:hypothetical protein